MKNLLSSHQKNISSNHFFSKTVSFTKFLPKKCESKFLPLPQCAQFLVHYVSTYFSVRKGGSFSNFFFEKIIIFEFSCFSQCPILFPYKNWSLSDSLASLQIHVLLFTFPQNALSPLEVQETVSSNVSIKSVAWCSNSHPKEQLFLTLPRRVYLVQVAQVDVVVGAVTMTTPWPVYWAWVVRQPLLLPLHHWLDHKLETTEETVIGIMIEVAVAQRPLKCKKLNLFFGIVN